jgi:hypothetical protein
MSRSIAAERRRWPRKAGVDCAWLVGTRVRPGRDVSLLDLSRGGALVEGAIRLLPGAVVELQLLGHESRHVVRGHVLRCAVSALDRRLGVHYRAAVRFDQAFCEPEGGARG